MGRDETHSKYAEEKMPSRFGIEEENATDTKSTEKFGFNRGSGSERRVHF